MNTTIKLFHLIWLLGTLYNSLQAQEIVRLYPGKAPGSESWIHTEKQDTFPHNPKWERISNVVDPTLTVYKPKNPNGMAMVVCPGGAFHFLAMTHEGYDVATWLNRQGITAFILKYRLVPSDEQSIQQLGEDISNKNWEKLDALMAPYVKLAVEDGHIAIKHIRENAQKYGIHPQRIGMMGFSAGATLAASVAKTYAPESRPNFVAPIYAYVRGILGNTIPEDAPPMFLALSADDFIAEDNTTLYETWKNAGGSVEMHIYPDGGHGFGMEWRRKSSDTWRERLLEWLNYQFPTEEIGEFWKDIDYVGDDIIGHKLDIHLPFGIQKPIPTVIAIYGSAWFSNSSKGRIMQGDMGKILLKNGFAVVSINHRSSHDAIFPAQIQDVKAAIRFIRANAAKYGIDTSFIAITGSSSGGHLAALAGTSNGVKNNKVNNEVADIEGELGQFTKFNSNVHAVIDWYGPTNFLIMDECGSSFQHNGIKSPESTLIGGEIQKNKDKVALANPITYVTENNPPFLIFHGNKDPLVPHCQSEKLHEILEAKGIQSELVIIPGGKHGPGVKTDIYFEQMISFLKSLVNN